jgi:hypothetical protein
MTRSEIRHEIFELLRESLKKNLNPGSIAIMDVYGRLQSKVGHPAINRIHPMAREIMQELLNNNVLFFGAGDDQGWPWFTLTEYGKNCILTGELLPFDPEGYLVALNKRVQGLDSLAMQYLREAISTYNRGFFLSAAVALGIATEHLLLRMIDSYIDAHADGARKAQLRQKYEGRFIFTQYSQFKKELPAVRGKIPADLLADYETHLEGIFNLIRLIRNQSGHPSGFFPDQVIVAANLQAFSSYAIRVIALEQFFKTASL